MPGEHETRSRVFYDHEDDEPRRRRRAVADWGVDEDGFDRMPSRRFARRGEEPRHAPRDEQRPEPVSRTIVIEREPAPELELPRAPEPEARPTARATTDGRRTIVIGGHPDRLPLPRNRPPRTAVDRIGPRPDRIVAYAVALGFLLILIAILTSH